MSESESLYLPPIQLTACSGSYCTSVKTNIYVLDVKDTEKNNSIKKKLCGFAVVPVVVPISDI